MNNRTGSSLFDMLPDDMLINIYDYFDNINDKDSLLSTCSLFYHRLQSIKNARVKKIHHNLRNLNCDLIKMDTSDSILNFYICHNLIVVQSYYFLTAYDLYSFQQKWVHKNYNSFNNSKISIERDRIIYTSKISNILVQEINLTILDLYTGDVVSTVKLSNINLDTKVKLFGNQVFGKYNDTTIMCWDLSGKIINKFDFSAEYAINTKYFFITNEYIIDIGSDKIAILNRSNGRLNFIINDFIISSALIRHNLLICGTMHRLQSPDLNIYNINTKSKIYEYRTNEAPLEISLSLCIAAKKNYVVFAHQTGKIILIDLLNHHHHVLEITKPYIYNSISIQEGYLLIISASRTYPSTISIWNIEKREKMLTLNFDQINDAKIHNDMLFISTGQNLLRYNFNVSHQNNIKIINEFSLDTELIRLKNKPVK